MSVSFNDVVIQNPALGNAQLVQKSQQILRPPGSGQAFVHDLDVTLRRLELPFRGLRDVEKAALETFFESTVEGVVEEFLFRDHHDLLYLAHFAGPELAFRCVGDQVAGSGTLSAGGVDYPTTTREAPVWDVDVELEVLSLPLLFDGTMEDAGSQWSSIQLQGSGTHSYESDAARSGSLGSRPYVPGGGSQDDHRAAGIYSGSAVSVWFVEFFLNFGDLTMADGDNFWLYYEPNSASSNWVELARAGSDYKIGRGGSLAIVTKGEWIRVGFLGRSESRAGALDDQRALFVDGELVLQTTRAGWGPTTANYWRIGFSYAVDPGTLGYLHVDDVKIYGVA